MKKSLVILLILIFQILPVNSNTVFIEKSKFGLKDASGEIIVKPIYNKMIKLGDDAFIIQKKNKYGIIDINGKILIAPKYTHANRFFDKYVKMGNTNDYGVFNNKGETLLQPEYTSIELLSNNMLLTLKKYKYGITDFDGKVILKNVFDDIYMPDPNTLRIQYNSKWYEIQQISSTHFELPENIYSVKDNANYKISDYNLGTTVGYSAITFTDYLIKMFSSISPAHEETIDELLLSHGADTVQILMKMSWIPKYPLTFIKKYYSTFRTPNNGPLSVFKDKIKSKN